MNLMLGTFGCNSQRARHTYQTILVLYLNIYLVFSLYSENIGHNPYIEKYDKLNYDTNNLRNRRSTNPQAVINLSFKSHDREFKLRLTPTTRHFFANNQIEVNSFNHLLDLHKYVNFYEGYLTDELDSSHVSGSIIDGLFYGTVNSKSGKYFIESSRKYNSTLDSHSIMYHEDNVNLNRTKLRQYKRAIGGQKKKFHQHSGDDEDSVETAGCGSARRHVKDSMKREQEELYKERLRTEGLDPFYSYREMIDERSKYTKEANENYAKRKHKRQLNEPQRIKFPNDRTICNLYLRVDPQLHTEIFNNEGNRDPDKTYTFLLFYLNKHVEALNSIYNGLQFFDSNKEKYLIGLQFMIYRTKIITEEQCRNRTVLSTEELKLCEPYLDVSTFLNYVSLDNFTDYCLAYTFTARDFTDGTLGLAWVAKLSGSVGGVCEKRQTLQQVQKSLNSGIVTVVNYQARVPEAVSQITFAHEVGHNFGSEHDPDDSQCSPGSSKGGNFIMYRRATTGVDKNNRNFSQCSRDQMGPILHALAFSSKFCFKQYSGSLCGNGIVEEGEECDCGYGTDCKESCCVDASQDVNKCKLKPGKSCSPSQGPCCDNTCNFASASTICMQSNECLKNVFCSGTNATCPRTNPLYFKPERTECNSGTQVCRSGVCSGSICEKYEMQQCFLEGDLKDKKQDKAVLCHLACIGGKTDNRCVDSFNIPEMTKPNSSVHGLVLKPGSPCVGTQGYCDIFSKCRAVDAEGPLVRLKNLILNPKLMGTIREWVTTYWWAAALIAIGLIVFMVAFIKICSVHTPSSNPRKPPALKITDTLRRPIKNFPHPHFHLHHHNLTNLSSSAPPQAESSKTNKTKPSSAGSSSNRAQSSSQQVEQLVNEKHHGKTKSSSVHHQSKLQQGKSPLDKLHQKHGKHVKTTALSGETESGKKASKSNMFTKRGKHTNEALHYYNNNHPLHPMSHVPHHQNRSANHSSHNNSRSTSAQQHQNRSKSSAEPMGEKHSRSKSFEYSSGAMSRQDAKHAKNKHKSKSKNGVAEAADPIQVQVVSRTPSGGGAKSSAGKEKKKDKKKSSTETSSIDA